MSNETNAATICYEVYCVKSSYKEWEKLNHSIKLQFIKKLQKLISNPKIEANKPLETTAAMPSPSIKKEILHGNLPPKEEN